MNTRPLLRPARRLSVARRRLARAGVLLLCGAVSLTGCDIYDVPLPGGTDVGSDPIQVHVLFRDVLDLVPQSQVKVNDITVGKITSIKLKDYTADVTIQLKHGTKLPANERASIQQTSLLGEKFVALQRPADPSGRRLADGDVIPLSRTGRNPEVEEVLGALSALLNGGGVAQLKTIASELNTAVGGREQDVRSVLDQLHYFMGELDRNKASVVDAIDHLDRLARELHRQDSTIKLTLDKLPAAVQSINGQRADLVRTLKALNRLSGVGVRVINASKEATIDSLRDLAPVLNALANAGQDLPQALQIGLTYPFPDAAVGNSPQVARNLHMGDYVNLSVDLNLDLAKLVVPGLPDLGNTLTGLCKNLPKNIPNLGQFCHQLGGAIGNLVPSSNTLTDQLNKILNGGVISDNATGGSAVGLGGLLGGLLGGPSSTGGSTGSGGSGTAGGSGSGGSGSDAGSGDGGDLLGNLLGGIGLGRAELGPAYRIGSSDDPFGLRARGYDPGIGTLLLQGVTAQ